MSDDLDSELDRMQGTIDSLRAENARLNKENDDWHEASRRLREEAQTARLALDVAQREIERVRAKGMDWMDRAVIAENKLKWFEEREPLMRKAADIAELEGFYKLHDWEQENPPPGAAT